MNQRESIEVAPGKTAEDWWALRPSLLRRDEGAWRIAAEKFFLGRLTERYLRPVEILRDVGQWSGEGFAILTILCGIVEFLESTVQGVNYCHAGEGPPGVHEYSSSSKLFTSFLTERPPFAEKFDDELAAQFYAHIRCGLLHEARTKGGWRIHAKSPNRSLVDRTERIVFRDDFLSALQDFVSSYSATLRIDPGQQDAFIRKFDAFCKDGSMGQHWVYKATPSIATLADTRTLALKECFLAKAAYEKANKKTGKHSRADHVRNVHVGDVIHFYFHQHGTPVDKGIPIGSFEIVAPPASSSRFAWPVEDTHLARVVDPSFEADLKKMGYDRDPKLPFVPGWVLKHLDRQPPKYNPDWFPAQHVLRRFG